jgi:type IV secretion system protein VirD4
MRGLPIGYHAQSGKKLRYETRRGGTKRPGQNSVIVIGPPRSGKGTGELVPMLLEYEGSAIVISAKADLCAITADHRRKRLKQDVSTINPFNEAPDYIGHLPNLGFNPLDTLDPDEDSFALDCDAHAESIVPVDPQDSQKHFPESGQMFVSGAIMSAVKYAPPEKRSLVTVFDAICGGAFFEFAQEMVAQGDPLLTGRLGRAAAQGAGDNKEIVSMHSSAVTGLRFMANKASMRLLSPTSGLPMVRWEELRKRPTTIYIIIPPGYLAPCSRVLRLAVSSAIMRLLKHTSGLPVLLLVDEFAALGHMAIVENTMALQAGLNLTMMPVVQSADQLKQIYGDRMHSFLACAGCQIFLPPREIFSARLISDLCGQTEVITRNRSVSLDPLSSEPRVTDGVSQQSRPLLLPDEVMALGRQQALIRMEGVPNVILAHLKPYYENREYNGLWAPDPYHAAKTGGILSWLFR